MKSGMGIQGKFLIVILMQFLLTSLSIASPITVGEQFPAISIANIGECVIEGDETTFKPWHSNSMLGKVQVFEYVAARAGIDEVHRPFFVEVQKQKLPVDQFAVTKLVNANDSMWGTAKLVPGEIKKNKRQTPDTVLVVDAEGLGLQQWQLEQKNAALAILDQNGKVLFFKQGSLTNEEISAGITLIKQQLLN